MSAVSVGNPKEEFIGGLALGPLTPGPVLMIAAAVFLPSFILMLAILPVLDRVRQLAWVRAVMKGMAPAVIGVLAVSLVRLAPAALPDPIAIVILAATVTALMVFQIGAFKLMVGGAILGVLRSHLAAIPGFQAVKYRITWTMV